MQAGRLLSIVVGGIVAVIAVVLLCVKLFIDPNHYKPRIDAAVKDATGRELVLQGNVTLAVFPWLALELGAASLGNPPGFGEQPFIAFRHAAFPVRLLPLLTGRFEIGRVELDGLDVRLIKNAAGKGNWEGFGDQEHPASAAPPPPQGGSGGHELAGIAGIQITNARISYNEFVVENLNIETGSVATKEWLPVSIRFDANRGVPTERANVDARFDFSGDPGAKRYRVAAVIWHGTVNRANEPRPLRWSFSSPSLDVDVAAQSLSAPAFALDVAGAQVTGSLAGNKIVDAPDVTGKVALAPLVVREYLPRWGLAPPRTRDPKALALLSASTAFAYRGDGLSLDDLLLTLDDTHVKGHAGIVDLKTQAIQFALAVDTVDLDRYLPPATGAAAPPEPTAVPPAPKAGASASPSNPLNVNGTLTVGAVHLAPLDLTQVSVTLAANGGLIRLFPLQAQIDGGEYSGNIALDGRESVPLLTLDEHLTGIDVGKLVKTGSKAVHASGRGNVSLKASARGAEAGALLKTLNGQFDAFVAHGALEGVDIGFQLGRAEAVIRRQEIPNTPDAKRTRFDALKMSAQITNGVAQTQDLTISSPVLKVTGQGSANLATQALDFSLLADTLRTAGATPIQLPIKVTGTATDPTLRPDLEALAKGQLRQRIQDVVQDKLKGLFNR